MDKRNLIPKSWPQEDIDYVRDHYQKLGFREVASRLHRNATTVQRVAQALGLTSPRVNRKWIPTPEIDKEIRKFFRTPKSKRETWKELSARTGWPSAILWNRARQIGANLPPGAKKRICLCCDTEFMSEGIYNRICPTCTDSPRRPVIDEYQGLKG